MKSGDELYQFYLSDMRADLAELEGRRKVLVSRLVGTYVGVAIAFVVLSLLLFFLFPFAQLALAVVGIIALVLVHNRLTRGYTSDFQSRVIGKLVRFMDPGLTYAPEKGIAEAEYMRSKIFTTSPDRYHAEDLVWGKLGETVLAFSEVHSEYKTESTDSDGHTQTTWHTIFRGLFFIADFNKNVNGEYVVLTDTAQKLLGSLGQALQKMTIGRPPLIKMEDPEFEKLFVVYGTDQIEARYILTPGLMRRITEYRKKTGKEIQLGFNRSQMYVAISYPKNVFQPRLFHTLLDFAPIREYYADLALAGSLVEEMNLNTRIWGKA